MVEDILVDKDVVKVSGEVEQGARNEIERRPGHVLSGSNGVTPVFFSTGSGSAPAGRPTFRVGLGLCATTPLLQT